MEEFKERGRKIYRDLLEEDLNAMKLILEGGKCIPLDEEMRFRYEGLAANVLSWKRLIKLNQ